MSEGLTKEEFEILKKYIDELISNWRVKLVMKADRLIDIRDYIEFCDHRDLGPLETCNLLITADYWERCRKFWLKYRPNTESAEIPEIKLKTKNTSAKKPQNTQEISQIEASINKAAVKVDKTPQYPQKTWEINSNDRRFLRSLQIAADEVPNPNNNDDGA